MELKDMFEKNATPTKAQKSSSIAYEESEETSNQVSQFWKEIKELDERTMKKLDHLYFNFLSN